MWIQAAGNAQKAILTNLFIPKRQNKENYIWGECLAQS